MKKFCAVLLVFGIILYLGFLAFNISRNVEDNNEKNKQEELLQEEINKIYNLNYNTEEVDMTIKTTLEYGKIETIIKKYYSELYDYQKEIDSLAFYNTVVNTLSFENLDSADLDSSKKQINNKYERSLEKINKIIELLDEEYILNLGSDISNEYTSLYKTLAIPTNILEIKGNWENKRETIKETYSLAIKALNILDNNKNLWHVENNKLYFHDEKLLNEYNSIISSLKQKNK